ncbi:DUF6668 family protein [Brachybacterium halotolerans]|uniref:DUF6668 family protein n=1 Tax=Brachybacterium halotolerans TaxID=2795215 RepID=UPI002B1D41F2|nr:DUF6668 family protein [Brachybacterium halotolerans]
MGDALTDSSNPWVTRDSDPEPEPTVVNDLATPASGPTSPQAGVTVPSEATLLPTRERWSPAALWVLGTHGGAGESSLAALVPEWSPAEHEWPHHVGESPTRVLLTARTSMRGLLAARAAATQWAAGRTPRVDVLGLVLIADAPGRVPRPLRDLAGVVSGGVPRTWSVPWVESWRLGESPTPQTAPRAVRRLVEELHVLLERADGTTE